MDSAQHPAPSDRPAASPGAGDVNFWAVLGFAAALVVTAVIVHLVVWVLFRFFDAREAARVPLAYPLAIGAADRQPPEPRLQINPRDDLRILHAQEDDLLNNYRWVDQGAGVVRIPIEEAIKITARRGLPAQQGKAAR
jgi:hypothetical protein